LDHFISKNATGHAVNSYYTLAISYCTFCVEKHTILGSGLMNQLINNLVDQLSVGNAAHSNVITNPTEHLVLPPSEYETNHFTTTKTTDAQ